MNPAFFDLPPEKRRNLLSAGYQAFALSPYGKASMAAVAQRASISKALLFYYFRNKQELYLYLFEQALGMLRDPKLDAPPDVRFDLFGWVGQTVRHRLALLAQYPSLMRFATRAYYETDPAVQPAVAQKKAALLGPGVRETLAKVDTAPLRDPADAEVLLNIILQVAEGCMRGQEVLNAHRMNAVVAEFERMMASLRKRYYKPEYQKGES